MGRQRRDAQLHQRGLGAGGRTPYIEGSVKEVELRFSDGTAVALTPRSASMSGAARSET
jgi:hypothetical protein